MNYLLVVLTHGVHEADLAATLAAFAEHVTPDPTRAILRVDGPASDAHHELVGTYRARGWAWSLGTRSTPRGFCGATRDAWLDASVGDHDHVFWLEHDFVISRPVDLRQLADVLNQHPMLAQMALMRDAVNQEEKAAGGLYESRRGQYDARRSLAPAAEGSVRDVAEMRNVPEAFLGDRTMVDWVEHRAYLTSNPSLMARGFMRANPWPAEHAEECEGRFGLELRAAGYTFGAWGNGEPWCTHIGHRTGFGY